MLAVAAALGGVGTAAVLANRADGPGVAALDAAVTAVLRQRYPDAHAVACPVPTAAPTPAARTAPPAGRGDRLTVCTFDTDPGRAPADEPATGARVLVTWTVQGRSGVRVVGMLTSDGPLRPTAAPS